MGPPIGFPRTACAIPLRSRRISRRLVTQAKFQAATTYHRAGKYEKEFDALLAVIDDQEKLAKADELFATFTQIARTCQLWKRYRLAVLALQMAERYKAQAPVQGTGLFEDTKADIRSRLGEDAFKRVWQQSSSQSPAELRARLTRKDAN